MCRKNLSRKNTEKTCQEKTLDTSGKIGYDTQGDIRWRNLYSRHYYMIFTENF